MTEYEKLSLRLLSSIATGVSFLVAQGTQTPQQRYAGEKQVNAYMDSVVELLRDINTAAQPQTPKT